MRTMLGRVGRRLSCAPEGPALQTARNRTPVHRRPIGDAMRGLPVWMNYRRESAGRSAGSGGPAGRLHLEGFLHLDRLVRDLVLDAQHELVVARGRSFERDAVQADERAQR